jgi:phosphoglycolate phosphatase-like HAD superfamily hydrolase
MEQLRTPRLIFWDFDGVIKDSDEVKSQAFVQLFAHYGAEIAGRVREHHETHGGMSRFEKIPCYLEWAGETVTPELVEEYCRRFALLTLQGVIDATWVPGAEAFLRANPYRQKFVVVTATPQEDIEKILAALKLRSCFMAVCGAPLSKQEAINTTLVSSQIDPRLCLMIGDANADRDAAQENHVPFLLRRHATNGWVFKNYKGDSVKDFAGILRDITKVTT